MELLIPKKTKFKKYFRINVFGKKAKGHKILTKGQIGLSSLEGCWLTINQLESARKAISRQTKKFGKIFINVFPSMPVTKKPAEVRMGSGKGSVDHWVAPVKIGTIIFELSGVPKEVALKALRSASFKLPIKCKVVFPEENN